MSARAPFRRAAVRCWKPFRRLLGAPLALLVGVAVAAGPALAPPADAASRPPVRGTMGAVSTDEAQATEVGLEILRRGGNAVDAAVATALALAVVQPEAGNLGGGGFAVLKMRTRVAFIDFRETAPAGATRDMYLDESGEPDPQKSWAGPLASGVPGSPEGLFQLHYRYGRLALKDVAEPARRLATDGFVVSSRLQAALEEEKELLSRFPETAEVWLPKGEPLRAGSKMRLPELGATIAAYAEKGPKAVTTGPVAEAVERAVARHGGVLTAADMAAYQPEWREPVRFEAFGWKFISANLPSSGGIILGQALTMLEKLDVAATERGGAERAHLLSEVLRRTFADRFLLGDPDTTAATAAQLLKPAHLAARAATFDPAKATDSNDVAPKEVGVEIKESADTTHLSVVDASGNLVALTFTINGLFGCGLYVPEAGFFLNNEMDDFAAAPGKANFYGLVQGEANAIAPGKRMLSSMSPTIAWRDVDGLMVEGVALGGRGGSRIPTSTLQVLVNLIVDGDDIQSALDRPRIHHQWRPDQISYESDALAPETRAALEAKGHVLMPLDSVGQVQAVRFEWSPGAMWLEAAAEPRGGGGTPGVARRLP
ncbi:MAG: gamma-glutamyltransferase [Acidobacteriota bacterium]